MRRNVLLVLSVLTIIGVLLFARADRGPPVIGFAYARTGVPYLDLARSALVARGTMVPRFVFDSAAPDETSDGALAQAAAFVADQEVAVVVGPSNSRHALATAPAYNAGGLPHIVPSATSRRLREAGAFTFTLVPDDSVEGDYLARFARNSLGVRRALLFYVNDEYGEGLRAGIVGTFSSIGGVVVEAVPIGGDLDVAALLAAALARHRADLVFVAGRSTETALLVAAMQRTRHRVPIIAGDGAYLPAQLEQIAGKDLSGLYVLAFWVYDSTDAGQRAFAARVRRTLGRDPAPEDALTEDALVLATEARLVAGSDRVAIQHWLAALGHARPPFRGLTGNISFGPERELPLTMVRFRDGKPERVDRSLVAPAPSP